MIYLHIIGCIIISIRGKVLKKNKLAISAGVVLIVTASLAMMLTMFVISIISDFAGYYDAQPDHTLYVLAFMGEIFDYFMMLAEGVLFLVLGIKILKHGLKGSKPLDHKGLFVTTCVLAYISAVSNLTTFTIVLFGGYLASAILLTKCLSKSSGTGQISVNKQSGFDVNASASKLKTLRELKEQGVISEEDFNKYLQEVVNKMSEDMVDGEK